MCGARVSSADAALARRLRHLPHAAPLDRLLDAASHAVEHGALWLAVCAVGVTVDRGRRAEWRKAASAVAAAEAASQLVKSIVRRERPPDPVVAAGSRFSFPSAHTANTTAAALTFPRGSAATWAAIVVLTGCSRPYLGVHYPSDVLAGAVLGAAAGAKMRS